MGRTVTSLLLSFGSLGVAAFFLVAQTNVLPVDVALNGLFLVQVLVQILWLIYNARNFAHTQTTRFYLHFDRHGALLADREEEHRQRRRLMEEQQRQRQQQQQQRGVRRHPQ